MRFERYATTRRAPLKLIPSVLKIGSMKTAIEGVHMERANLPFFSPGVQKIWAQTKSTIFSPKKPRMFLNSLAALLLLAPMLSGMPMQGTFTQNVLSSVLPISFKLQVVLGRLPTTRSDLFFRAWSFRRTTESTRDHFLYQSLKLPNSAVAVFPITPVLPLPAIWSGLVIEIYDLSNSEPLAAFGISGQEWAQRKRNYYGELTSFVSDFSGDIKVKLVYSIIKSAGRMVHTRYELCDARVASYHR